MTHRVIKGATYVVRLTERDRRRGSLVIEVLITSTLDYAVPMEFELKLPADAEVLRELIYHARIGDVSLFLAEHGYDEYGNGRGTWGRIA